MNRSGIQRRVSAPRPRPAPAPEILLGEISQTRYGDDLGARQDQLLVFHPDSDPGGPGDEVVLRLTIIAVLVLIDVEEDDFLIIHIVAAPDVGQRPLHLDDDRDTV